MNKITYPKRFQYVVLETMFIAHDADEKTTFRIEFCNDKDLKQFYAVTFDYKPRDCPMIYVPFSEKLPVGAFESEKDE